MTRTFPFPQEQISETAGVTLNDQSYQGAEGSGCNEPLMYLACTVEVSNSLCVTQKGQLVFRTRGTPLLVLQDSATGILRLRIDNRYIGLLESSEIGLHNSVASAEGFRFHRVPTFQWAVALESVSYPGKYLRVGYYRRLVLSDKLDDSFELQTSFRFLTDQGHIVTTWISSVSGGLSNVLLPQDRVVDLSRAGLMNINEQRESDLRATLHKSAVSCANCHRAADEIDKLKLMGDEYKVQYRILKEKLFTQAKSEEKANQIAREKSGRAEYFEDLASQCTAELLRLKQQLNLN